MTNLTRILRTRHLGSVLLASTLLVAPILGGSLPTRVRAASTPVSQTSPGDRVVVRGSGGGVLTIPGFEGDRVTFTLAASAPSSRPVDVTGWFHVTHRSATGSVLADFTGTVDCLMAGGGTAVATGLVTQGSAPGLPGSQDLIGHRIGLTVADGRHGDHIGWSWYVMGFHDVPGCTGTAPFFPLADGGFSVRGGS